MLDLGEGGGEGATPQKDLCQNIQQASRIYCTVYTKRPFIARYHICKLYNVQCTMHMVDCRKISIGYTSKNCDT
jgi:hypothetical protein